MSKSINTSGESYFGVFEEKSTGVYIGKIHRRASINSTRRGSTWSMPLTSSRTTLRLIALT